MDIKNEWLKINNSKVKFSFWPVKIRKFRNTIQNQIFTNDPWSIILSSIKLKENKINKKDFNSSISFIKQAQDYYLSSTRTANIDSKPLLIYYCFLNLVKALLLVKKVKCNINKSSHGMVPDSSGSSIEKYKIKISKLNNRTNIVYEFGNLFNIDVYDLNEIKLSSLLSQIIFGHRIFSGIIDKQEKFIGLRNIKIRNNKSDKKIWLEININEDDLKALKISANNLIKKSNLSNKYVFKEKIIAPDADQVYSFKQIKELNYSRYPADKLSILVNKLKNDIWTVLLSVPPYRKYYLYLRSNGEKVVPQLLSYYMVIYFLSSITRYHPLIFQDITTNEFSPFINSIITEYPPQFIYLIASEFIENNVTKPAIIN